ncbi:hypothetical protein Ahy_B07g087192 [Arachis hypogaea]|uniref:Aminotransferase-like plant mobile domain-containing protein n=1 Tax=Arachis hypogaea TaxID=3818 RepID=A0A444YBG8_ARAHY|nr:hypothetical protein Ahy_B07g087192 [Arachis hypogaea]
MWRNIYGLLVFIMLLILDNTGSENVTVLGLPMNGLPVTGITLSSFAALKGECFHQFGVALTKSDCRGSSIRLMWLRDLKERLQFINENSIQRYVKCHIMLLLGTILFGDKSGASVHWKYLPLLRDFGSTGQWRNWERGDRRYRYLSLAHFRKSLDELQKGHFVWVAYGVDRIDLDIIPEDINMHSVVWSAMVPLISFECIEWHATDRFRRQFSFVQGAHGETLTGPKNFDWARATSYSFWVIQWTNRYNHILTELPVPP